MLGVAAAVSVLGGALVVGDSVRGSLRDIALGRLGRTETRDQLGIGFFRDELAADVQKALSASGTAPLIVADGFVTHESSGRRAGERSRLRRRRALLAVSRHARRRDGVCVSPALAAEIGAKRR